VEIPLRDWRGLVEIEPELARVAADALGDDTPEPGGAGSVNPRLDGEVAGDTQGRVMGDIDVTAASVERH